MNLFQLSIALTLGLVTVFRFHNFQSEEQQLNYEPIKAGRKTYFVEPLFLPLGIGILLVMLPIGLAMVGNGQQWAQRMGQLGLVFVHISVYYALLLLLLPLLRRVISAQACAILWLLPSTLYLVIMQDVYQWATPRIVLPLPLRVLCPALILWGCGFMAAMGWQLLSHLRLRRALLSSGQELKDPWVEELWSRMAHYHGVKREIPLLVCPEVSTPLTVGCFERTMFLALPRACYTPKEWELIFRHELRHIIRCDSRTKVLLGFCAATCWFNPLGWIACRRAAEDLELSCDEAVLEGEDENTRKEYAGLLLKSAGTGRGYTTCLSAAAGALRHRLRNVVKPEKRLPGGLAVGTAMFLLIAGLGTVALADSPASAQELIFDRAPGAVRLERVGVKHWNGSEGEFRWGYEYDAQKLTEYLSSLTLRPVYIGSFKEKEGPELSVTYEDAAKEGETGGWWVWISLYNGWLTANLPYDGAGELTYRVEGAVDWAYLNSLLDLDAPNPNPIYHAPELNYQVTVLEKEQMGTWTGDGWKEALLGDSLYAAKQVLSIADGEGTRVPEYEYSGVGGTFGQTYTQARLEFSTPPVDGYTVTVERWDGSGSYTLSSQELEGDVVPLAPYSAHYTVRGEFAVGNALYDMEFYFDIGQEADQEVWQAS